MIVVFETPFSAPIAINSDHVLTLTEEHERVGACCRVYLATDRGNGGLQVVGSLASVVAAFNGSVTPTVANPVPVASTVDDVHKEVVPLHVEFMSVAPDATGRRDVRIIASVAGRPFCVRLVPTTEYVPYSEIPPCAKIYPDDTGGFMRRVLVSPITNAATAPTDPSEQEQ